MDQDKLLKTFIEAIGEISKAIDSLPTEPSSLKGRLVGVRKVVASVSTALNNALATLNFLISYEKMSDRVDAVPGTVDRPITGGKA